MNEVAIALPKGDPSEAPRHAVGPAPAAGVIERTISVVSAFLGGGLVLIEACILGWGVFTRYILDSPSSWSDELATILFLWLTMVGAVLALCRSGHMRLTAAVEMIPAWLRPWIVAFAHVVSIVFIAVATYLAVQFTIVQANALTQALEIPDSWRASAMPIAFASMLAVELSRLSKHRRIHLLVAFAVVCGIGAGLFAFQTTWHAMGPMSLIIFFGPLALLGIFSGAPIGFCFGVSTIAYLVFATDTPLPVVMIRMDVGMSNLLMLAVPMFIFLGLLFEVMGIAGPMIDFLAKLLGHVRGGLQYVLLGAMFLVSGISGSKIADMAAVAPALLPEMKRRGLDPPRMVALLAASGVMAETIPPALVLITIGAVAGVSISALFAGGTLPAVVAALALAGFLWWQSRTTGTTSARASGREILRAFLLAAPGLALPLLIRFFVLEGITTATEVSTVGAFYCLIVGVCTWRNVNWKRLLPVLADTAALSGAVMFIVGAATAMAWALTQSGFSRGLVQVMGGTGSTMPFMAASIVVFIILGSLLEGLPVIVLFGPLVFPVARALQINDVHYAMVIIIAMGIGVTAPPFGLAFYAACAIGQVPPNQVMRHIWPYLMVMLVALIVIAAFPVISTLPL
jgi:tripartite ATP-independent transporter DctM subunit